jgi:hypothetical protein
LLRRYIIKTSDRVDNLLDPPFSPKTAEKDDPIRVKRKNIIEKTERDVLTLLLDQPPEMEVPTELLSSVVLTAVDLSDATLNTTDFSSDTWEDYLQAA